MQTIAIPPTERQPVPRLVGTQYVISNYLRAFDERRPGPQAFLVEQRSPKLRAHLHEVDQFQVVLEGEGTLGRDRVAGDTATRSGLTELGRMSRGAVAYVARLAAAELLVLPEATSASGGYGVVLDGALDLRGTTYPPGSLVCFESSTGLTDARAGADGLLLAVLIFAPAA